MGVFRNFITTSGKDIICGKNAESNEELVKNRASNELFFHTRLPGSPFCKIKDDSNKITEKDRREVALICARYSQDWRDNKKNVDVHYFLGKDIYKLNGMDLGTFGVKNTKKIIIKREEILNFLKEKEHETTNRN